MNIGLVRMKFNPYGGAEVFLSRLIERLVDEGHECHIFAREWGEGGKGSIIFHRVWALKWSSLLKVLSFVAGSYLALRREPLDVIFSFERTLYQDVYRAGDGCHREWLIQRKKTVSPFKYLTIALNPFHWTILLLEGKLFRDRRLKAVIANSGMVRGEIIRHYGLPEDKVHVIYNGFDSRFFDLGEVSSLRKEYRKKLGIEENSPLLLFVGSGFERKGLPYLIEAIANLKRRAIRAKLVVVGKGKTKRYKRLSKKLKIDKEIIFIGPQRDMKGYYSASDLFVLPTLYDPFSNATLEAMACGLPVVTSRFNGASEVVEKEGMGCIIQDPTDSGEIVRKIEVLLKTDKKMYEDKGKGIAQDYSIEKTVKEFLKVLEIAREQREYLSDRLKK